MKSHSEQSPETSSRNESSAVVWWFGVAVLGVSFLGFGSKFVEFVQTFRESPEGIFAISPVINYLLATTGFFFLMLWAGMQGMFRDIEAPKRTMLDLEEQLTAQEGPGHVVRPETSRIPRRREPVS